MTRTTTPLRRLLPLLPCLLMLASASPARAFGAGPGDPDPGFGTNGTLSTPFGPGLLVPHGDGFLDTAGGLQRRLGEGSLDGSFGTDGTVQLQISAWQLVVADDGSILAAGAGGAGVLVQHVTAEGVVDAAYGGDGVAEVPVAWSDFVYRRGSLALRAGGGAIVVGSSSPSGSLVAVALDAQGQIDPGFGDGGTLEYRRGAAPTDGVDVVIRDNGSIVVAGTVHCWDGDAQSWTRDRPMLLGLRPDGSRSARFGRNGVVLGHLDRRDAWAVLERGDGRLILFTYEDDWRAPLLSGFLLDGRPDPETPERMLELPLSEQVELAHPMLQADGKIVLGVGTRTCVDGCEMPRAYLARLRVDGRLNRTFGTDGVTDPVASMWPSEAVLASGRLLLGAGNPLNAIYAYTP